MARRPLSDADVLRCLQGAVDVAGGQRAWAARHGLNQSHVSKALLGKRPVPASVLAALGLRELPPAYAPAVEERS
jgi:hypothetical protein